MRSLRWVTAAASLLVLATLAMSAAAVPLLYVEPSVTEVWTGGVCWVDIAVNSEVLGLTGYDLEIDYDESVVELVDVVEGPLPQTPSSSFFFWTIGPGPENAIVINGAVLGDSVDGPGVLAKLCFSGLAPGTSPVDFLSFELRDLENQPIIVSSADGEVIVADPPAIYLTPALEVVNQGDHFTIDVAITGSVVGLTGYNLRLELDSTIVQFVDADEGPLPPTGGETYFFWIMESPDIMMINGAVLGSWVDGPGVLAHVELFGLSVGTTPMDFLSVELRDIENNPIPVGDEGAVIIVEEGGSPVESTTWAAIKSHYE